MVSLPKFHSLQTKILSVVLITISFIMALWGWMTIRSETNLLIGQMEKRAHTISRTFALSNTDAMLSHDYPIVQTNVEMVGEKDSEVIGIDVIQEGKKVASYQQTGPGVDHDPEKSLIIRDEMSFKGQKLGQIEVIFSTVEALQKIHRRILLLIMTIALVFLVLSSLLIGTLKKMVISPIALVAGFARQVGQGSFQGHLDMTTQDEIGELAQSMNQMVLDLDQAQKRKIEQELLKNEMKVRRDFFANVSHELKTPMTLVVSPLENLLRNIPQESSSVAIPRETFEIVRHNAYRLSGLISDLLDLTRSEIGKARLNAVDIEDVEDYFRKIFKSVFQLMVDKEIQSEFVVNGPIAPHFFDRSKIDKVVVNLLSNALKFTPRGGRITLRVGDENDDGGKHGRMPTLKISVEDSGVGIPADKLPFVFERFMQVNDASTSAYGGMGIGLSLVKEFAELHGGHVSVESQVGKGTTFSFVLPRGKENLKGILVADMDGSEIGKGIELPRSDAIQMTDVLRSQKFDDSDFQMNEKIMEGADPAEEGREAILLVDDNAEIRKTLRQFLGEKFRIVAARDGAEGVIVARQYRPYLIISDVMMPKKDGYGLLADIKSDPELRVIPVILLTSKAGEENVSMGFQFGADDYVTKPFQPKEILSRVQNLIRLRHQREEIARQRDDMEQLNKMLKEAESELIQSEKLSTIGLLAAGFAHEINNPIYAITMNVGNMENVLEELKANKAVTPELLERLSRHRKRVEEEALRIKKIMKSFLNYSQKNRSGLTTQDLNQDIESTLTLLKTWIDDAGATIHWEAEKKTPSIEADHGAINQIFTNLIQNAIHAGAKNVWVQIEAGESSLTVKIRDDGSGIPPEILPRIFDPFFTTKEVGKGSGLGLNIVQRIATTHHGDIRATSRVGVGTEFTLVLPLMQPVSDAPTAKVAER